MDAEAAVRPIKMKTSALTALFTVGKTKRSLYLPTRVLLHTAFVFSFLLYVYAIFYAFPYLDYPAWMANQIYRFNAQAAAAVTFVSISMVAFWRFMHRFCLDKSNPDKPEFKVAKPRYASLLALGFGWILGIYPLATAFEALIWASNVLADYYLQARMSSAAIGLIVTFFLIFLCVALYFILTRFYTAAKRIVRRLNKYSDPRKSYTLNAMFHPENPVQEDEENQKLLYV